MAAQHSIVAPCTDLFLIPEPLVAAYCSGKSRKLAWFLSPPHENNSPVSPALSLRFDYRIRYDQSRSSWRSRNPAISSRSAYSSPRPLLHAGHARFQSQIRTHRVGPSFRICSIGRDSMVIFLTSCPLTPWKLESELDVIWPSHRDCGWQSRVDASC